MASHAYIAFCEKVKAQTDIAQLFESWGCKMQSRGRHQLLCCSPFRNEQHPSCRIYTDQQSFYDYGASFGGDCFDAVQAYRSCDFNAAVDFLADRLGTSWQSTGGGGGSLDPETHKEMERFVERRRVERVSTDAARYYHSRLPPRQRRWLKDFYGFDDETIDRQLIGWADNTLLQHLRAAGHSVADVLKTGLFLRLEGGRLVEHHSDRITFPYLRGSTAPYMISRRVDGVTPDTSFQASKYKKSLTQSDRHPYVSRHVRNDIFYGEDSARRHQANLVITEGVPDAISALMCGWAVISPCTIRFKKEDIDRAVRLTANADRVVVINDHEKPRRDERTGNIIQPGLDGAADMAKVLFEAGRDVRIGILPRPEHSDKVDLNSFVRDKGCDALTGVIDKAMPFVEFLVWRIPKDTRPSELDEALSPVYEAIGRIGSALEREAYVTSIATHFGITTKTVGDAVDEFLRVHKLPAPPPLPVVGNGYAGDGGGGGGGEGTGPPSGMNGSSGPPTRPPGIPNARGHVYTSQDNYYYVLRKEKDDVFVEERISDFVLDPKKIVQVEHGRQVCCDIFRYTSHAVQRDVVFPPKVFSRSAKFKEAVQNDAGVSWYGSDHNVQAVFELLNNANAPIYRGVPLIGYAHTKNGPRFVLHDRIVGVDGTCRDSDLVYAPPTETAAIASRLKMDGADMPETTIARVAQRAVPKIFRLNSPEVILALVGWFFAACIAPQIRAIIRHFPILSIWGSQGCGKTTLVRDIFWPWTGVVGEPFSCSDTPYALMKNFSTTSSVALVYDEYRGLTAAQKDRMHRLLREIYVGGEATRGRADQKTNRFRLLSPVVLIGESLPEDPAIMERMVCASPLKNTLTAETGRLIRELANEPLYQLGGHLHRWCLSVDVPELVARARAQMHATMLHQLSEPLAPRVRDNLLVTVIGNMLCDSWCAHLGVIVPDRPKMRDHFTKIVSNITESEGGGGVRDAFDRFLEACSTYAHTGALQEGVHYAVVSGSLCLHLESCYQVYLVEQRRANLPDDTNGRRALKRACSENLEQGRYIIDRSRRVRLGGRQIRCVVIDPTKIPDHLAVEEFPVKENRIQGHQVPFGGWGPN